ncbi:MAG: hypothetical protein WA055_01545 [Candidatus Moraniibacteriota bacterium]
MVRKMSYGIKVSYPGFSATDLEKERSQKKSSVEALPNLLSSLALPYLFGAKKQINRYKTSTSLLSTRPILSTMECLHEASTLFEDLNTVAMYANKCNQHHEYHRLFRDICNHIRHTVREDFDIEDKSVKNEAAKRLGLDSRLQINIGFDMDSIKVGEKVIKLVDIKAYLDWAEGVFTEIINRAKRDGAFREME